MLTQKRLKELLNYDPLTGVFTWLVANNNRIKVGAVAGTLNKRGYVRIGIDSNFYAASRLAFLYMTGKWPKHQADHKDIHKNNNIWTNLREATHAQNQANKPKYKNNFSGFKGACWNKSNGKWIAQISVGGKTKFLGYFDDPRFAHLAYCAAALRQHGQFVRTT